MASPASTSPAIPSAVRRHDRRRSASGSPVDPEATGRENLVLEARIHGLERRRDCAAGSTSCSAGFDLVEAADRLVEDLLGRDAPQARRRDGPGPSPDGPVPRRAHDRARSRAARAELWAEIGRLTREDGLTILLTTHYLEEADRLAGRLAIVDRGRIVATGTPGRAQGRAPRRRDPRRAQRAGGRTAVPPASLTGIAGLDEPVVDGRSLRARATDGAALVPAVLSALDAAEHPGRRRSPSRARRSTTSTSATPGGPTASRPRSPTP